MSLSLSVHQPFIVSGWSDQFITGVPDLQEANGVKFATSYYSGCYFVFDVSLLHFLLLGAFF
jgi:hypothetical protein